MKHQKPLPEKIKLPNSPYLTIFLEEVLLLKESDCQKLLKSLECDLQELEQSSGLQGQKILEKIHEFEKIEANLKTNDYEFTLDVDTMKAEDFLKVLEVIRSKKSICVSKDPKRAASAALFLRSKGYQAFIASY